MPDFALISPRILCWRVCIFPDTRTLRISESGAFLWNSVIIPAVYSPLQSPSPPFFWMRVAMHARLLPVQKVPPSIFADVDPAQVVCKPQQKLLLRPFSSGCDMHSKIPARAQTAESWTNEIFPPPGFSPEIVPNLARRSPCKIRQDYYLADRHCLSADYRIRYAGDGRPVAPPASLPLGK